MFRDRKLNGYTIKVRRRWRLGGYRVEVWRDGVRVFRRSRRAFTRSMAEATGLIIACRLDAPDGA